MLSINVLIITYKQEKLIGRALDSILCQKEFGLNQIVISDDCSPDHNWDVIQEYKSRYPQYICAYRNEKNLGIYGNAQIRIERRGTADLYLRLAGDDALCDGFFKSLQEYVRGKEKKILNHSTAIYSDWKVVNTDGSEQIYSNKMILKYSDALSLKCRGVIYNRSVFLTEKAISQFSPIDLSQGLCWAEDQFDTLTQKCSDLNLYFPFVGSIYFSGIGVSTKMSTPHYFKENIQKYLNCAEQYPLNRSDKEYMIYYVYYYRFRLNRSGLDFMKALWHYILSAKFIYLTSPNYVSKSIREYKTLFRTALHI